MTNVDWSKVIPMPVADDDTRRHRDLENELRAMDSRDAKYTLERLRKEFAGDAACLARIAAAAAPVRLAAMKKACVLMPERDLLAISRGEARDTEALSIVRSWQAQLATPPEDRRPWLFLLGQAGIGKTYAAACALAEAHDGRLIRASQLVTVMYPSYDDDSHGEVHTGWFGVLEDLGVEFDEKRFSPALAEYLETRLDKPTIVTSNLSAQAIRDRYDPRLADRIRDLAVVVEMVGPSMRRQDGGL